MATLRVEIVFVDRPELDIDGAVEALEPEIALGMAVDYALGRMKPKPPADAGMSMTTLSRREMEVARLVAEGLSNREIAEKLFVSENTVKTHSSRVFEKLGARRRTQAVQLGKEFGLLP